jgi:1-acyl-sn-glycerol-3-phosphate acyltransferase
MTTSNDPSLPLPTRSRGIYLPPLTAEVIDRARQGLRAGRDRYARAGVKATFATLQHIVNGSRDYRINGELRRRLLSIFIHLLFKVTIENPENIPTTPVILAPNHLNHIDPFVVLSTVPGRPYYYIVGDARTMYNRTWKRLLIRLIGGVIPIDRLWKEESAVIQAAKNGNKEVAELAEAIVHDVPDGGSIEVMRQMDTIVRMIFARGDSLLIFPEGTLGPRELDLCALKKGTVVYAMRAGVPVVPVALVGTHDLFLRKRLTIRFGKPINFPQNNHPRLRETETALDQVGSAIQALFPASYEEPSGPKPLHWLLNRMFL